MDITNVSQIAAGLTVALLAVSVGIQAIIKNWKSSSSETNLLQMMHTELERMSMQNTALSNEIGKLQLELINLSKQLSSLNSENKKLQAEVSTLNDEISRLHSIMVQQSNRRKGEHNDTRNTN